MFFIIIIIIENPLYVDFKINIRHEKICKTILASYINTSTIILCCTIQLIITNKELITILESFSDI